MTEDTSIRVMIVDDHQLVRRGIAVYLMTAERIHLVGEANDGEEAVQRCAELHPDVVLMDIVMPLMNGIDATRLIREKYPEIQVIALTSYKEDDMIEAALKAGAIGYLLKDASIDIIVEAIYKAVEGEPTLAPEATKALIRASLRPTIPDYNLTERELEVLSLMARGLNNPQIADHLMISRSTVKFHVSTILSKLGVATRTEAAIFAKEHNLVKM